MKYLTLITTIALSLIGGSALALNCSVPENGNGTADLPVACPGGYLGQFFIIDGLVGGTIEVHVQHYIFQNATELPGGNLGGHRQTYDATLVMLMTGTGNLAGFNRAIFMQLPGCISDSGPRVPFSPLQNFSRDFVFMQGEIFGDPDFDLIRLRAGTSFGLPSPGQTTLTDQGGTFNVDSFFDIEYQIEFEGAPGSILEGFGRTTHSIGRIFIGNEPVANDEVSWGSIKCLYGTR